MLNPSRLPQWFKSEIQRMDRYEWLEGLTVFVPFFILGVVYLVLQLLS